MTKRRVIEYFGDGTAETNFGNWPMVNTSNFSPEDLDIFNRRKTAIEMYIKREATNAIISQETGIEVSELRRFIKRCLELDENGVVWGYRGLIPGKILKPFTRNTPAKRSKKTDDPKMAGAFDQLLRSYPAVKEKIENLYLGREKRNVRDPIMSIKVLHRHFLQECRNQGITMKDYPFNTKNLGQRSLYRYVKELENIHFSEAAKRYGEVAVTQARHTGIGLQNSPMIIRPYERVQFDGHRIDATFAISFRTPEGDEVVDVMERVWLLSIIDVATRTILGYHISFNKEYSASDVLQCIRNAVVPWKPKEFTIPGLKYPENGGFPSGIFPEAMWGLWDEFCYDNGKANLANIVRDRLTQIVGCSVNAGPVSLPQRRGIIERFFQTLEENGYHRLPSTTGSNPRDPRRQNAEKKAIKYRISAEHVEELTEALIATYNGTPHEGINNLAPLEAMQQRIDRGEMIRQMPNEKHSEVTFLSLQANRIVKGGTKEGKRPYVQYEGVIYRNEVLSRTPELIGTKLDLFVNIEDLRVIRAFLPDGSEFGVLTATGKWGVSPHSLQDRKQINKLRNEKLIHFTSTDDPIEIYHRYLETQAMTNKRDRNRYADQQRKKKNTPNSKPHPTSRQAPQSINSPEGDSTVETLNRESYKSMQVSQQDSNQKISSERKIRKTISY